jgi:hypothetical protein
MTTRSRFKHSDDYHLLYHGVTRLSDLHMISKELHFEYGTTSTFKKVQTRRERETKDHLTLGLGVGVGLPFLAAASVKGQFDQNVEENTDVR